MHRIFFVAGAVLIIAQAAWGQSNPVAAANAEICRKDPKAYVCHAGEPVDFSKMQAAVNATPQVVLPPKPHLSVPAAQTVTFNPAKTDWRFAHPKPDLLLSVNVGAIVRSPVLSQSLAESFNMMSDVDKAKIDLILKMVGTVDRVQVSLRTTQVKNDPDFLVLVTGNLDGMVRQMLTQQSRNSKVVSRQIASNAILFGKAPVVELAAARMSGVSAPLIADAFSSSDVWISGDSGLLKSAGNTTLPPGVDSLKRFAIGMNFRDPVEFSANLSMSNEQDADKLIALYNLMAAQAAEKPEAAALASSAKVDRQGTEIHFRFSAPVALLQAQMKGMAPAAGQLPGLLGMVGMPSATTPEAAPPVPPKSSGKIMIYGLDDGPREVGAPKNQ